MLHIVQNKMIFLLMHAIWNYKILKVKSSSVKIKWRNIWKFAPWFRQPFTLSRNLIFRCGAIIICPLLLVSFLRPQSQRDGRECQWHQRKEKWKCEQGWSKHFQQPVQVQRCIMLKLTRIRFQFHRVGLTLASQQRLERSIPWSGFLSQTGGLQEFF